MFVYNKSLPPKILNTQLTIVSMSAFIVRSISYDNDEDDNRENE